MMRLVMLTGQGYEHCYVANRLAEAVPLTRIIVDRGRYLAAVERVRHLRRRYTARELLSRAAVRGIALVCRDQTRRREAMYRVLGRENCEKHLHEGLITHVEGINSPGSLDSIRSLQPDVLLIYGTAVVGDKVLSLASQLALNLHTGMSPYYRGAGCAFWPLYNGEPERLGATIHQCTSRLDGGAIYRVGQASIEAEDDLFAVFARCVKTGADLYVDVVRELMQGQLEGRPQQLELGREYRAAMKGWRHELSVRWKIRRGLIRDYVARRQEADSVYAGGKSK